jgi:hypothetical protein
LLCAQRARSETTVGWGDSIGFVSRWVPAVRLGMGMRERGRVDFVEADDGTVHVEVITRKPAGGVHPGRVWKLSDHLKEYAVGVSTVGVPDPPGNRGLPPGWRYLSLRVMVDPSGRSVTRRLDLYEGSDDRRIAAKLIEQSTVRFVWVNEQIELVRDIFSFEGEPLREHLAGWQEALENTRGVDRDAWREEIAELEWEASPSWRPGRPRPSEYKPRSIEAPEHPVPFFAPRSGTIPRAGQPTVADVKLPRGSRCLPAAYWATEEPVADVADVADVAAVVRLASRLAAAFPQTGLWPILWADWEDADRYLGGYEALEDIDAVDVQELLRAGWALLQAYPESIAPFAVSFPGLANASVTRKRPPPAVDPFVVLAEHPPDPQVWNEPRRQLLLVPCNRPADALTVLGYATIGFDEPQIGAMLRSWEERFAAVPVELGPVYVTLAVAAPPTTREQALRLAAEHHAAGPRRRRRPTRRDPRTRQRATGPKPPYRPSAATPHTVAPHVADRISRRLIACFRSAVCTPVPVG